MSLRRRRSRNALLLGRKRQKRSLDERLGKVFAGVVIAAVLCAGCVGWSFISHRLIGKGPYSSSVPSSPASTSTPASSPSITPSSR